MELERWNPNMKKKTKNYHQSMTKTAKPASSEPEDWCMLPDIEDVEKIVERELKKLKEWEIANSKKE